MKKIFGKYCLHCKYWKCERNWIKWIFIIIGILIIISLVIILLIVLPSTLITTLHIPFGYLNTDFTNTGQIGDTIGGITAPFIGLISIWLLYITFREQRQFNEKQSEFNNEQNKFNTTLLEFDKKQLELNHYTSFVTLLDVITQKLYSIKLIYKDGTYSTGLNEILVQKEKLQNIDEQEFLKLKGHLIYCHRLIRTFLQINKEAQLKQRIRATLYKAIKNVATEMTEIYSVLEECHQIQEPSSWTNLKTELNKYLKECNPEDKK